MRGNATRDVGVVQYFYTRTGTRGGESRSELSLVDNSRGCFVEGVNVPREVLVG